MLTEKERSLLAPRLARIRATQAELAKADQDAAAASRRLEESKHGTDWRDRWFGGLFSRDPARARAYHDARRANAGAAAAVTRQTKQLARITSRVDTHIRPRMSKLDPGHKRFIDAIEQCNKALRECGRMQQRIAAATASARAASVNPGQDDKAAHTAERARRLYPQLVAKVVSAAPDVSRKLDAARLAVRAAGGETQHLAWNAALFDQLPQAAADFAARRRPARAQDPLRRLHGQLNQTMDTVKRWRTETTTAEANAVAAARDRLVNDSDQ